MIPRRPLLFAALLAPATLRAQEVGGAQRPLRIGVTAGPHAQVIEKVRETAAYQNQEIKDFIATTFQGAVAPAF